MDINSICKTCD